MSVVAPVVDEYAMLLPSGDQAGSDSEELAGISAGESFRRRLPSNAAVQMCERPSKSALKAISWPEGETEGYSLTTPVLSGEAIARSRLTNWRVAMHAMRTRLFILVFLIEARNRP